MHLVIAPKSIIDFKGSIKDSEIIMENISDTKPPSLNHLSLEILTITGTIDVLINLARVSLNATERL